MSLNQAITDAQPAVNAAAAGTTGYKAVVLVFMDGGNDQSNTIFPVAPQAAYDKYYNARSQIAFAQNEGIAIAPSNWSGPTLHLHPNLVHTAARFSAGKACIVANVGMLSVPLVRSDYVRPNYGELPTKQVPYQLTSHVDQQLEWATVMPNDAPDKGWAGKMCDMLRVPYNGNSVISPSITVTGNRLSMTGYDTPQYQVSASNGVALMNTYGDTNEAFRAAQIAIQRKPRTNVLEQVLKSISNRAFDCGDTASAALSAAGEYNVTFPGGTLATQLHMVSRLIKARAGFGHRRDVFCVQFGSFDFHSNLRNDHGARMAELDNAMEAFYQAIESDTDDTSLANKVTLVLGSDFGRSLQTNGDGSDHGWGGHYFVYGGNCKGNQVLGTWPDVGLATADDMGTDGRLLPSTSVDQYYGAVARWMGIPDSAIPACLPYRARFGAFEMYN